MARDYFDSLKASRDQVRAYLQEKKGLIRTYAPGDRALRTKERADKSESYYDRH